MQRTITSFIFSILCLCTVFSQNISVASFSLLENDLTANTQGTIVYDQNGEKCALIKVETTQTGFSFDAGSLGIVKNEQKVGEIWVYVPSGVKRLSIFHQQLGNIRDYDLGLSVQKAKTYLLKLTTGTVNTVVQDAITNQYLVFRVTPNNAMVLVNDVPWPVTDGVASKYVPFGIYTYRVMAPDYFDESGIVTVNDPNNRHEVNVNLKGNYSSVTLTVDNDAEIWVDGVLKGIGSCTGNLGTGDYVIETRKVGHRSAMTKSTINSADGNCIVKLNAPTPIYGKLDVNTQPFDADIMIDGVKVGTTPSMITQILEGTHQVTIHKKGYKDLSQDVIIEEGKTSQIVGSQLPETSDSDNKADEGTRVFTVNGVSFRMIRVEGGKFKMGATREQSNPDFDEKPKHDVSLGDYYIGETEVTQTLWTAVMEENPSGFKEDWNPVEKVSWEDCVAFILKLNQLTGENFRLPTEAEWEFAARGGKARKSDSYFSPNHNQYSGSNDLNEVGWFKDNSNAKTHIVKSKQANVLVVYDMSGNVWEWCQDWYGNYNNKSVTNPTGPSSGSSRVIRGGGWNNFSGYSRVASRDGYSPNFRSNDLGFRLAL